MYSGDHNQEAVYEQMMEDTIRSKFEKNGTMAALRSEMHLKVLQLLRGQQDMLKPRLLTGETSKLNKPSRDQSLIKLINQLIMEFFNWFGYRHTLETFRMETGDDMAMRNQLEERLFIIPDSKDLPLLAQLVMRDWKSSLPQKTQHQVPQNPQPSEQLEVQQTKRDVKVKKLIQNNQKLIASDPMRKVITIKEPRSPPPQPQPIIKNAVRKVSVESSESDIFESDFSVESEDSDAYADIPDRHVFVDDLPPEGKYISDQGEEGGPYDIKQSLAECLFQQYQRGLAIDDKPTSSREPLTLKGKKCEKSQSNVFEGSELDDESFGSGKLKEKASTNKPKVGAKNIPTSADEPETHITGIDLDSEDNSNDEASS
ncbi:hypothetical protein KR032_011738 [Drosophila birchii]|nr:hypothetical protein KR032_011738 [Drosophila birchii]